MELALSLGGDNTPKRLSFLQKTQKMGNRDLGFCMGLGPLMINGTRREEIRLGDEEKLRGSSDHQPVQLDLLPLSPVQRSHLPPSSKLCFPWLTENLLSEPGTSYVNRMPLPAEEREDGASQSSPNSTVSSYQHRMNFSVYRREKRDLEINNEFDRDQRGGGSSSRASGDEEEINGLAKKKLRLSKEQSAFLEESFNEHSTLNPKLKVALAKQLNLRPRQIEVWFQNRRARTKLKQTEVDCEYLKRCYETLTEENRRLQKEVQELRALKTTSNTSQPNFYHHPPATTLTMCPSCERVASTATTTTKITAATVSTTATY